MPRPWSSVGFTLSAGLRCSMGAVNPRRHVANKIPPKDLQAFGSFPSTSARIMSRSALRRMNPSACFWS